VDRGVWDVEEDKVETEESWLFFSHLSRIINVIQISEEHPFQNSELISEEQ